MYMQVHRLQWQRSWRLLLKVATIGLFVRYLLASGAIMVNSLVTVLTIIAVLSILVGNLLAVRQVNLKSVFWVIHLLLTLVIC